VRATQALGVSALRAENFCVTCTPPYPDVYRFAGRMKRARPASFVPAGRRVTSANSGVEIGCYVGKTTKMAQDARPPLIKWTRLEPVINECSGMIFGLHIVTAGIFGAIGNIGKAKSAETAPYMRLDLGETFERVPWLIMYVRVYPLSSVMISISLKVTIDACKYVYTAWIRGDARPGHARQQHVGDRGPGGDRIRVQ